MVDRATLKPGAFYWVIPNWDVDFTPPGFEGHDYSDAMHEASCAHWSQNAQPARFNGLTKSGEEMWTFLGQDDPDPGMPYSDDHWWGVRWVGDEIALDAFTKKV